MTCCFIERRSFFFLSHALPFRHNTCSKSQVEGELGAVLLDPDFALQLAVSKGSQMLRQTQTAEPRNNVDGSEVKSVDDEDHVLTTPIHDMRAPEPTSHIELAEPKGPDGKSYDSRGGLAESKSRGSNDEVKPSWEEAMQSTGAEEGSSLIPRVTSGVVPASQKEKSGGHSAAHVVLRGDAEASIYASLIDDLRNSVKHDVNEAIREASLVQQSRMDSLEASLDGKLERIMRRLEEIGPPVGEHDPKGL